MRYREVRLEKEKRLTNVLITPSKIEKYYISHGITPYKFSGTLTLPTSGNFSSIGQLHAM